PRRGEEVPVGRHREGAAGRGVAQPLRYLPRFLPRDGRRVLHRVEADRVAEAAEHGGPDLLPAPLRRGERGGLAQVLPDAAAGAAATTSAAAGADPAGGPGSACRRATAAGRRPSPGRWRTAPPAPWPSPWRRPCPAPPGPRGCAAAPARGPPTRSAGAPPGGRRRRTPAGG